MSRTENIWKSFEISFESVFLSILVHLLWHRKETSGQSNPLLAESLFSTNQNKLLCFENWLWMKNMFSILKVIEMFNWNSETGAGYDSPKSNYLLKIEANISQLMCWCVSLKEEREEITRTTRKKPPTTRRVPENPHASCRAVLSICIVWKAQSLFGAFLHWFVGFSAFPCL